MPASLPLPKISATARLEARITHELHALLKRASELQGRTMTDFIISAVQSAAVQAIDDAQRVQLSLRDQERFAQALLAPSEPTPAMQRAKLRHAQRVHLEE